MGKALSNLLPPICQTIHQTVAGHFRGHSVEKDLIGGRQENAYRGHGGRWLKIMVGSLGWDATLSTSRKGADLDGGLRIHRDSQHLCIRIGLLVHLLYLSKDGIGFGQFF